MAKQLVMFLVLALLCHNQWLLQFFDNHTWFLMALFSMNWPCSCVQCSERQTLLSYHSPRADPDLHTDTKDETISNIFSHV